MAEREHVSDVLSSAAIIMHTYYTVLFLSLLFFKEHFFKEQFCNGKMRRKNLVSKMYFKLTTMKVIFKH